MSRDGQLICALAQTFCFQRKIEYDEVSDKEQVAEHNAKRKSEGGEAECRKGKIRLGLVLVLVIFYQLCVSEYTP